MTHSATGQVPWFPAPKHMFEEEFKKIPKKLKNKKTRKESDPLCGNVVAYKKEKYKINNTRTLNARDFFLEEE